VGNRHQPNDPRRGRAWQALAAHIIDRDRGICWRCGHPGADTAGHILSYKTHPHLATDPGNLRAEHGTRRTLEVDGYECRGNYASKDDAGHIPKTIPRRNWI
jgi:hypothetical protein